MNIGGFLKAVGSDALKVGEVAAPIAAQIFMPQFAGAVQNLVATAEQKFPSSGNVSIVQTDPAATALPTLSGKTGPAKLDFVKTSITAALPFIEALAAQHGIKIAAQPADIETAIEASVTAYKADAAAIAAVEKLFTTSTP